MIDDREFDRLFEQVQLWYIVVARTLEFKSIENSCEEEIDTPERQTAIWETVDNLSYWLSVFHDNKLVFANVSSFLSDTALSVHMTHNIRTLKDAQNINKQIVRAKLDEIISEEIKDAELG